MWSYFIQDVRIGQVSYIVPRNCISELGWKKMSFDITPKPNVANKMEAVLRMLCFHSRAGKLNETLERLGVKNSRSKKRKGHLTNPLNINGNDPSSVLPPPRKMGELILSREAEEAAGLHVPRGISRSYKINTSGKRPLSASKIEKLRKDTVLKSDLIAAQYEFQTTGYNRSFRRWIDPLHDTGDSLNEKSVAGLNFVCGFPGCGHCTSTKLSTHGHYLNEHRTKILENRTTLMTKSNVEHLVAPLWPVDVPWKQEFVRKNGKVIGVKLTTAPSEGTLSRSNSRGTSRGNSRGNSRSNSRNNSRNNSRGASRGSRGNHTDHNDTDVLNNNGRISPLGSSVISKTWDVKKTYQPKREPLGRPLFCKRKNCHARFLQFNELYDHQRNHEIQDEIHMNQRKQDGLVLQLRRPLRKPSNEILDSFLECQNHRFLLPNDCAMCARVSEYQQPRRPCIWYRSIQYYIPTTGEPHTIDIEDDQYRLPMIQTRRKGTIGLFPLVVYGIGTDEVGKIWLCGKLLIRLRSLLRDGTLTEENLYINEKDKKKKRSAKRKGKQNGDHLKGFDLGLECVEDDQIQFFPLLDVMNWCYVGWCDSDLFYLRHYVLSSVKSAPNICCCRFQLKRGNKEEAKSIKRPETSESMHHRPSTGTSSIENHPRALVEKKKLKIEKVLLQ